MPPDEIVNNGRFFSLSLINFNRKIHGLDPTGHFEKPILLLSFQINNFNIIILNMQ